MKFNILDIYSGARSVIGFFVSQELSVDSTYLLRNQSFPFVLKCQNFSRCWVYSGILVCFDDLCSSTLFCKILF